MGYERSRFIDLDEDLICSVCLNVFHNAIRTICDHNFCKQCVEQIVLSNKKTCPECRTAFTTINPGIDSNSIIIGNFFFGTNRFINNMVNKQRIKCVYESNGCKESLKLMSLEFHLKDCPFKTCKKCELPINGSFIEHNCIELLKKDRNEWILKCNSMKIKLEEKIIEVRAKDSELEVIRRERNDFKYKFNEIKVKLQTKVNENKIKNTKLEDEIRGSHLNGGLRLGDKSIQNYNRRAANSPIPSLYRTFNTPNASSNKERPFSDRPFSYGTKRSTNSLGLISISNQNAQSKPLYGSSSYDFTKYQNSNKRSSISSTPPFTLNFSFAPTSNSEVPLNTNNK